MLQLFCFIPMTKKTLVKYILIKFNKLKTIMDKYGQVWILMTKLQRKNPKAWNIVWQNHSKMVVNSDTNIYSTRSIAFYETVVLSKRCKIGVHFIRSMLFC